MLIVVVASLLLVTLIQFVFSSSNAAVAFYAANVFYPFQVVRNATLGFVGISIGDIIYILGGIFIIVLVVKWIYYLIRLQTYRRALLLSLLRTGMVVGVVYIWFFIGWGGNYSKPRLAEYWSLEKGQEVEDDSTLIYFDKYLIDKLNEYAPQFTACNFREIERRSRKYYGQFKATEASRTCINVKPSLYGNLLEYSGIQGYYNPFTGEGQVNANLPSFLLPFTTCHEMGHQVGIAAEEDANLLAFVVGTESKDPAFVYSAYFNIWLYTNSKLRGRDSVLAKSLRDGLNPVTLAHIDTLRALRKKYKSPFSKYSSYFYDNFLKLNKQKKGMDSYDDVVNRAYAWEQRRLQNSPLPASVP